MVNLIEFQISVQDDQAADEQLIDILAHLAMDLESQNAVVTPAKFQSQSAGMGNLTQGGQSSGLLNIEINPDTLPTFSQWLYERLVGTTTKVNFEDGDLEFVFQEHDNQDRSSSHQEFEAFVNRMEAAKRAPNR